MGRICSSHKTGFQTKTLLLSSAYFLMSYGQVNLKTIETMVIVLSFPLKLDDKTCSEGITHFGYKIRGSKQELIWKLCACWLASTVSQHGNILWKMLRKKSHQESELIMSPADC